MPPVPVPVPGPNPCPRGPTTTRYVVLTGGPGAGKTAVLELVRRSLCPGVALLPEAASILFSGGFWRRPSVPCRQAAQRAIFHIQRQQERMVAEDGGCCSVLCDRGTLDGLAYWPAGEASFWQELGTSRSAELARYHAVIHLQTPTAEQGYNHQNPLRTEDAAAAHAIDLRIAQAWEGHPNRVFIESSADFLDKALRAVAHIKANLPDGCRQAAAPT